MQVATANEVLERVASLVLGNSQEEDTAPTDSPVLARPSLTDLDTAWTSFIASMQPLQDLIASEEQEKKAADTEDLIIEQKELWSDSPIEQSVLDSLIEEDDHKLSTSEIEELIIEEFSREYKLQQATEFLLPPFGEVTVHAEEEYFVLRSHDTGRTIMSATMAGEIINEISEADTDIFNQVLKQSEIEVNKLPESELLREDAQSNLLNPSPFNNTSTQKGFEYDG